VEDAGMTPREFPPPNASPGYASSLPLQVNRFFGREEEIAALTALLIADCGGRNAELPDKEALRDEAAGGRGTAPGPLLPHSAIGPAGRPHGAGGYGEDAAGAGGGRRAP